MGIKWYLSVVVSSCSPLICICPTRTDTRSDVRLVIVLDLGATHRSERHRKRREAWMKVGHDSFTRSNTELNSLRDIRTCELDKLWNHLCG